MNKTMNTESFVLTGFSKKVREMILIRNEIINNQEKLIDILAKENYKLKEELKLRC